MSASRFGSIVAPLVGTLAACAAAPTYLTSAEHRRDTLVRSIVDPSNAYSRERLAHYGATDATSWDHLPEWNPRGSPARRGRTAADGALAVPHAATRGSSEALRVLGEEAFFRYPVQIVPSLRAAVDDPMESARVGLWEDGYRGVGGLVEIEVGDGERAIAVTCATCHAKASPSGLAVGVPNDRLDFGRILALGGGAAADRHVTWGRGRVDVTTTEGTEPMRIPDLRPVRFLSHLHHAATLTAGDEEALAVRIETLIIVASGATRRPPRAIALALAVYVRSLADALPAARSLVTPEEIRGRALFDDRCARCHIPPAFTGPPVALAEIGTEPTVGRSRDRGTGKYRVPSLRGVSTRGPLLHDGTVPSLDVLLDPARTEDGYPQTLHGAHSIPGHLYGLDLGAAARFDLLAFLHTL